jgi:hypothetical protein
MRHHLRLLAFVAFVLVAPLRAQGLVQISLAGAIATPGGARVEIDIASYNANSPGTPVETKLNLLLGEGTSAADLGLLLARRLEEKQVRVTSLGANAPALGPVNLFLENTIRVGLRLGNGLRGTVTLCENRPLSVKVSPGTESQLGATFKAVAMTHQEHTGDDGRFVLDLNFADKSAITDVGMRLVRSAISQGWPSELKGHDTWWPAPMTETQRIVSCSFEIRSNADWRLDVALAPR